MALLRLWRRDIWRATALADDKPAAVPGEPPALVETKHNITLAGHSFDYRAIAETIGLTDGKGEPTAVGIHDRLSGRSRRPRNGGRSPSCSMAAPARPRCFLHLGALGPASSTRRRAGGAGSPVSLADNPSTWLAFTDLVFVDPVGTGFSRGKGKEDNPDKPFWNVRGDVNSLQRRDPALADPAPAVELPVSPRRRKLWRRCGRRRWRAACRAMSGSRSAGWCWSRRRSMRAILHPDISNTMAPTFQLPSFAATAAALAGQSRRA